MKTIVRVPRAFLPCCIPFITLKNDGFNIVLDPDQLSVLKVLLESQRHSKQKAGIFPKTTPKLSAATDVDSLPQQVFENWEHLSFACLRAIRC